MIIAGCISFVLAGAIGEAMARIAAGQLRDREWAVGVLNLSLAIAFAAVALISAVAVLREFLSK